jgi:hypothetical protein
MARILWLPPCLLQGSTRSFTPKCAGHSVPTDVRGAPTTTHGPFAPETLPSILPTTDPCASPVASMPLRPWSHRQWSSPLFHPRLVHRTVLALTVWLLPKVSCPLRRVLAWCMWSVSSQATAAFASKRWLGALQVLPQTTSRGYLFSTLQAFSSIMTLSFTRPPGRSHATARGEGFVAVSRPYPLSRQDCPRVGRLFP